jgi:hypothetical protein
MVKTACFCSHGEPVGNNSIQWKQINHVLTHEQV